MAWPKRIPTVSRICMQCGAPFLTFPGNIRKGWGRFCSKSCGARYNTPRQPQGFNNLMPDALRVLVEKSGASGTPRKDRFGVLHTISGRKGGLVRAANFRALWPKDTRAADARHTLNTAVDRGLIHRPLICSRCPSTKRIEGHHEDYGKPLDVIWLCRSCHHTHHHATARPVPSFEQPSSTSL